MRNLSIAQRDISRKHYVHPLRKSRRVTDAYLLSWRKKTLVLLFLFLMAITSYYLFFSPFFRITTVETPNTQFIVHDDLTGTIEQFLSEKQFFIFPHNNFFLLRKKMLAERIKKNYLVSEVTINKKWPRGLSVDFNEQLSLLTIAAIEADSWKVATYKGTVIKQIKPFQQNKFIPLTWKYANDAMHEATIQLILNVVEIQKQFQSLFTINYFFIKNEKTLIAQTDKSFYIEFNLMYDSEKQLSNFKRIMKKFQNEQSLPSEYLLLGFKEKIFYK